MQSYYNIIDYIPCAVHFTSVVYLFYNWKFVLLIPLNLFHPLPHSPPFGGWLSSFNVSLILNSVQY